MMPYESARKILAKEISRLQGASEVLDREIKATDQQLGQLRREKVALGDHIKETAQALERLGGPVPDWTDDEQLIAFWEEVKREALNG